MVDEEVRQPLGVKHIDRINFMRLPQLASRKRLLLILGSGNERRTAAQSLGDITTHAVLFPQDREFTYRDLFDAIDLARGM